MCLFVCCHCGVVVFCFCFLLLLGGFLCVFFFFFFFGGGGGGGHSTTLPQRIESDLESLMFPKKVLAE